MLEQLDTVILADGIKGITDNLVNNWIGPIFLLAVAAFALVFIKDRAWMKLVSFVGIAAIVGLLIFGRDLLFGSSGKLTNVATEQANNISVILNSLTLPI